MASASACLPSLLSSWACLICGGTALCGGAGAGGVCANNAHEEKSRTATVVFIARQIMTQGGAALPGGLDDGKEVPRRFLWTGGWQPRDVDITDPSRLCSECYWQ